MHVIQLASVGQALLPDSFSQLPQSYAQTIAAKTQPDQIARKLSIDPPPTPAMMHPLNTRPMVRSTV